jgi:phage tail sheath gpL-like
MSNTASSIKNTAQASGSFYEVGVGEALGTASLLEQSIAVLAEGNTDMQTEIAQDGGRLTPLSSKEVAVVAGYGSPSHMVARRLFDDLSINVPVTFFFVPESGTGTETASVMTGTGSAITKTGTLVLNFNGELLSVTLEKDQTLAQVLATIKAAINAAINLHSLVSTASPTTSISIDSKWKGQSAAEALVSIYSNDSEGITWAIVTTAGTGEVVPSAQLAKFLTDWYPHVLNCLGNGAANAILDELEDFNGTPAAGNGKYAPENMTPFVAWTGSVAATSALLTGVTATRLDVNTNVYLPLPNAQSFTFLNAAEALGMFVKKSSGDPKQDIDGDVMVYAVPPADKDVGDIIDYNFRDNLVKNGCSTVNYKNDSYYAQDILTTYKPDGEIDPVFKFVRDNMLIFNLIDQFKKFNIKQKNKSIAPNALPSISITSPALYKAGILNEIIRPFVDAGYLADFDFAKANLDVGINPTNAGRFDVLSPNLITSLLRIVAVKVAVNKYHG